MRSSGRPPLCLSSPPHIPRVTKYFEVHRPLPCSLFPFRGGSRGQKTQHAPAVRNPVLAHTSACRSMVGVYSMTLLNYRVDAKYPMHFETSLGGRIRALPNQATDRRGDTSHPLGCPLVPLRGGTPSQVAITRVITLRQGSTSKL